MAEASLPYVDESPKGSEDGRSVPLSDFPSNITSVEYEAVMAAPTKKPEREARSTKIGKR